MSDYPTIPERFRVIDETNWNEYTYIMPSDDCWYIWERMSKVKAGEWSQYPTNGLISNLKIPVLCRTENLYRYRHKISAIRHAAQALGQLLDDLREIGTYVPMPPSKTKDHPEYDDRLLKVLNEVEPPLADIRDLVLLKESCDSKQKGRSPKDRAGHYQINEDLAHPEPTLIFLFDDVLTTGSHFKAIKTVLKDRFSNAVVYGLFLARAVRPPQDDDVCYS